MGLIQKRFRNLSLPRHHRHMPYIYAKLCKTHKYTSKTYVKRHPIQIRTDQVATQEDLKQALIALPALRPIDYFLDLPVILAVDMLSIAVGFYLCQANPKDSQKQYYARFGSIPLNNWK